MCLRSEVEKLESSECLVMSLELVDMALWVSMEVRPCEMILGKEALVEAMTVEQVESVGGMKPRWMS